MAKDESTPQQPESRPVERQFSSLLEYLQTPLKQAQEWVSGGQLQSTIEHLQEQAERAQEGVERRLRALGEVREGLEIHVRKQLEAYRRQRDALVRQAESAPAEEHSPPEPVLPDEASNATAPSSTTRPKARPAAKKSSAKRPTGRKR